MPKQHIEGNPERERAQHKGLRHAKNTIELCYASALSGSKVAVQAILKCLKEFPELAATFREFDDLMDKAENAWITANSFGCTLSLEATKKEIDTIKGELLSPQADILDRILVSSFVVSYLAYQRSARLAAGAADHSTAAMRDRQLMVSQKRMFAAMKAYEQIRQKKTEGPQPIGKLKLFEMKETSQSTAHS